MGGELAGLRLRVVRTGEGPDGLRRVEVVELGPARRTGWAAAPPEGDGFLVTEDSGQRRWRLDGHHAIEFQDVRLAGADRFVRFDADGTPSVVEADGRAVPRGAYVLEPLADPHTGAAAGLTVRLPKVRSPRNPAG
jgi:hypothetical protein